MALLTVLPIAGYALAAVGFLTYVLSAWTRGATAGRVVLAVAVLLQLADIGSRCVHGENPVSSTPDAMAFVAFLVAAGYLGASLRYRLATAGAFVVPSALILLVLARVAPAEAGAVSLASPLGRLHIFLATVGVAVFALAAAMAGLYLVEDRRLRTKRFGALGREAALATLDRLALRCVSLGFPVFTVAILTGAVWVARLGGVVHPQALRPEYVFAIATWALFGVLLLVRVGAGWAGRRAAWMTLGGFAGALLVLAAYFLRLVA